MSRQCIQAFVSGRVQGVFFRQSTRHEALRLGLTGSAVNLPDGRVEVIACGEPGAIRQLVDWLHQGPPSASVNRVQTANIEINPPAGFTTG